MIEAGLPAARLQHTFRDVDGEHVARTDFDWGGRLVGEFDGKVKYGRYVPEGKSAADVLWEEKRREDRIRATGRQVVRIAWSDLDHPELVDRMIRNAADRAGRRNRATFPTDCTPLVAPEYSRAPGTGGVRSARTPSEVAESDIVSMVGLEGVPTSREQA